MELLTNQRIGEKAMPFHLRLCSVFSLPFSRFPLPFHWIRDSRQVRGAGNAGRGSRRAGEEAWAKAWPRMARPAGAGSETVGRSAATSA